MPWVSPIPVSALSIVAATGRIVTVEEHGCGGLFAALSEAIAETDILANMRSVRLPNRPTGLSGSQGFLRTSAGLTVEAIVDAALRDLQQGKAAA
jgi:transketolase C-terminal domain/subunit